MSDIRLLISMHPDSVYTNEGHKVDIVSTSAGYGHNLIYGYVHKNGKKIGHYWNPNGLFSNKIYSPVSLKVKID